MSNLSDDLQTITEAVQKITNDSDKLNKFIHGTADEMIETNGGTIPTLAGIKKLAEQAWTSGQVNTNDFDDLKNNLGALALKDKIDADDMGVGVINNAFYTNSTRIALPALGAYEIWSETFEKTRDDSDLIISANLHGYYPWQYALGCYIAVDDVKVFSLTYSWDAGYSSNSQPVVQLHGMANFKNLAKGTKKISVGWLAGNSSATAKPFIYFNPNGTDNAMLQQTVSTLYVQETVK